MDPRSENENGSRNFWAQFMQNIGGAKTEGEILSDALSDKTEKMTFLIPIYEKMPESPSPDPAEGSCSVFASSEKSFSRHLFVMKEEELLAESEASVFAQGQINQREKEKNSAKAWLFALPVLSALFAQGMLFFEKNIKKAYFVKNQ